jgi:hypothetical protein
MKVVTLAAGLAVGYVLGTRAGREKYEQIVATVRKVSGEPSTVDAGSSGSSVAAAEPAPPATDLAPDLDADPESAPTTPAPRRTRRKPVITPPDTATAPLL